MTGNTQGTSGPDAVCTKQARIAELARQLAGRRLESLNHYLDLAWMQEACRRTRKDGAAGVDGVTWQEYSQELPRRLTDLLDPAKDGDRYRAPPQRLAKHGLTIHPEKRRLVPFFPPERNGGQRVTFNFLGFTHGWSVSRKGQPFVQRRTMQQRLTRALEGLRTYCRQSRHEPLAQQREQLERKMRGHYAYYGITGSFRQLRNYAHEAERIWRYWLNRRSRQRDMPWARFKQTVLRRFPLPRPRVVHSVYT